MKPSLRPRTAAVRRGKATPHGKIAKAPSKSGLDPKFLAAAKASRKKFGALFKRLAKT